MAHNFILQYAVVQISFSDLFKLCNADLNYQKAYTAEENIDMYCIYHNCFLINTANSYCM